MTKDTYIKAVLVVFGLLLVSRIPTLFWGGVSAQVAVGGTLDPITVVSSVVELTFLVWGIMVLRRAR